MGKAGFLLYGASGKIGNIVLSKGATGTTIREKVDPKNPKTTRQMSQRALFATAVRFYKHANQRFFKFAFEDKKRGESDYNAFMRHNLSKSTIYNYQTMSNESWPAIGNNWTLTQGSLGQVTPDVSGTRLRLPAPSITGNEQYFGEVCQALIKDYGIEAGDYITIVAVRSIAQSIDDEPSHNPYWDVRQYVIDPETYMELGDVISVAEGYVTFEVDFNPDDACAGAVVFSRDIAGGGVKVTSSTLVNNSVAQAIYDASLNEAYRNQALNSWGATGEAILQGSLAKNQERIIPTVVSVNDVEVPYEGQMDEEDISVDLKLGFMPASYLPADLTGFATQNGKLDLSISGKWLTIERKERLSGIEKITYNGKVIAEIDIYPLPELSVASVNDENVPYSNTVMGSGDVQFQLAFNGTESEISEITNADFTAVSSNEHYPETIAWNAENKTILSSNTGFGFDVEIFFRGTKIINLNRQYP